MMSSRHIRATKIKHASPPSAGWLLSLGLKTVVTHEQSSQTKTCTLCKSQRDSTYSKHQHTGVRCFRVRCVLIGCVWVSYSSTVLPALTHRCLFRIRLSICDVFFHLPHLSPGPQPSSLITLRNSLKPPRPINHYPSLQFGALQSISWHYGEKRMRPLGEKI